MTSLAEWRDRTLGEVLTLQRGFDLPARDRVDGPVPIVSSSGVTGHHAVAKVDPPGVVIGRYGTLGQVHWVTERYWPLNTALWVKDFKGNDPRFVSYLLRTVSADGSAASAVPGVNRNHLHRLPVRVPSVRTQRRIAATLAGFDELVAISERRIALLEGLARSLYREWFVRFKAPGATAFSGDGDGALPAGWASRRLGDVAENLDRLRRPLSKSERARRRGSFPYYGAAKLIDWIDGWIFEGEYLLFAEDGTVATPDGYPVLQLVTGRFWANNHTHILRGTSVSTRFLYLATSSYSIQGHVTGAAQPKITQANLNRIGVVVAPSDVHRSFDRLIDPMFDEIHVARSQIRALLAIRDLVLPRLVTGRLDIDDVDLTALLADVADA